MTAPSACARTFGRAPQRVDIELAIAWLHRQEHNAHWWGRCEAAMAAAFDEQPYATAIEHWWDLAAHGHARARDPHPNTGDLVFYDGHIAGRRTGHVGLAVANGRVITTAPRGIVVVALDVSACCYLGAAPALWPDEHQPSVPAE